MGVWVLAAVIAMAFSWGAVAGVRNQVLPAPIQIPPTLAQPASTAADTTTTIAGVTVIPVEPDTLDSLVTSTTADLNAAGMVSVAPGVPAGDHRNGQRKLVAQMYPTE